MNFKLLQKTFISIKSIIKIFCVLFFLFTIHCNAQKGNSYEFKFYNNGKFKSSKKVEVYLVTKTDSIKCKITNGQINIPENTNTNSLIINYKKNKYNIENIDFSKLDNKSVIIFGIEKNTENFSVTQEPDIYLHLKTNTALKMDDPHKEKKIVFLTFNAITGKKTWSSYCRIATE